MDYNADSKPSTRRLHAPSNFPVISRNFAQCVVSRCYRHALRYVGDNTATVQLDGADRWLSLGWYLSESGMLLWAMTRRFRVNSCWIWLNDECSVWSSAAVRLTAVAIIHAPSTVRQTLNIVTVCNHQRPQLFHRMIVMCAGTAITTELN